MSDAIYLKLAQTLDTLPNGFPSTESGIEIRLLKKIFRPGDAELFRDLRLNFETAAQIAERTGRPLEGLEAHLTEMGDRGQIFAVELGGVKLFKMVPWAFGIYEFQLPHMDRELAEMCEEYMPVFGRQFFSTQPQLMQVVPVEKEIRARQEALPYERVSNIIENSQSFAVFDCVCKKEQALLDKPCDKPLEICTAYAPIPGVFDNKPHYRSLTKEEAYAVLDKAERAGLVHLTWNVARDRFFICNCCGCCCAVLRSINELGIPAANVINSYYYADIDPEACTACGVCAEERCQVNAIEAGDEVYHVIREKCIGCGLCVSTCPAHAISLVRKEAGEIVPPPENEMEWYQKRAQLRGVDFSRYK
jgi:ferredoxin